jgi:hypothetical protein
MLEPASGNKDFAATSNPLLLQKFGLCSQDNSSMAIVTISIFMMGCASFAAGSFFCRQSYQELVSVEAKLDEETGHL